VSEESKPTGSKDKFWVIDPLDGTKDFIQKTGEFAVMMEYEPRTSVSEGVREFVKWYEKYYG
jgi:3'-phosphoadenosine 5'-phosphosulfate (PAPS) 3'-phosphatase